MKTNSFEFEKIDLSNQSHIICKNELISSDNSEFVSKDINNYINRNFELGNKDKITATYVVNYKDNQVGLAFVNYHPEIEREGKILEEEIEIGLGIINKYRGMHLGKLIEKELCDKLLELYPRFDYIVARIDNDNIISIKSAIKSGFEYYKNDEYRYKRK